MYISLVLNILIYAFVFWAFGYMHYNDNVPQDVDYWLPISLGILFIVSMTMFIIVAFIDPGHT